MPEGADEKQAYEFLAEHEGITEEQTEHGFVHRDREGRLVLRTETHQNKQTTQYEYPEAGGSVENAKVLEGPKQGEEYRREHPGTTSSLKLSVPGAGSVEMPGVLETLGSTVANSPDGTHQPWAHFEVTDEDSLPAFASIPAEQRQVKPGGAYAVLEGELGGGFEVEVYGRTVTVERIGRISVDFNEAGEPIKATIHKVTWSEKRAEQ
ncbi:MAG: hypothetical protein HYY50_02075 [Candidatus Kerfeldbacteria bacterium]|nr:hypothetical protein [Candidatus Kerfeldbacteria bacterium]